MKRAPDNVRYLGNSEKIYSLGALPPVTQTRNRRVGFGRRGIGQATGADAAAQLEPGRPYNVLQAGFDPYQSAYLVNRLMAEGLPLLEYRQVVSNMSAATKELQALILQNRIHHDGGDCLTWQLSNVVGHYDAKDNVYPKKERRENKIDSVIALIVALGIYISDEAEVDWSFKWLPYI
jgi:hypothetical protein